MSPSDTHRQPGVAWRPRHDPWAIALTVTLATFMEVLDVSIAIVALPHIAGSLGADQSESTWILTSYLVSNAIVLPLSAWLSSAAGRKRFYMSCVLLFTLSSTLCGLAPSLGALIVTRLLQGAAGGGLQPSEQAILADTFPPAKRGMAFAVYGIAVVCAPALGPTLGGWITDNYSWRWLFFINVPVGVTSLLLTHLLVEDPPHARARGVAASGGIDAAGIGLIALGFGALQILLDKGQQDDWFSSSLIVSCAVLAVVGILGAVVWERRQPNPVVDLRMFRERNFSTACALLFIAIFAFYGGTTLLPLFLQSTMGYTALDAGLALTAGALAIMVLMPVVGLLVSRVHARWLLSFGLVLGAYGSFRLAELSLAASFAQISLDRVVQASAMAFIFVPLNAAAYAFVPPEKSNAASSLINVARNLGGSIGISVVATLLDRGAQVHQAALVGHLSMLDAEYRTLVGRFTQALAPQGASLVAAQYRATEVLYGVLQRQSAVLAVTDAFRFLALVFVAGIPLLFLLKRHDPQAAPVAAH